MGPAVAETTLPSPASAATTLQPWLTALASAAMFGTSGVFAKPLLASGWSPGAAVAVRLGLAAVLLVGPAVFALRGRWHLLRTKARPILLYGVLGGATAQVAFFNAVRYIDVGVALLLEYLGVVLVVGWVWLRTRRTPGRITLLGMLLALGGLVVVLNPAALAGLDPRGLAWGLLAAFGLAGYFVISAETDGIPPVTFVACGLGVGTLAIVAAGLVGLIPLRAATADVDFVGLTLAWWVPLLELGVVAAAAAYLLGFVGARGLGSTVAGFVGLSEVVFAVVWAWLLLGEFPGPAQLLGGAVLLLGVAGVQWGNRRD